MSALDEAVAAAWCERSADWDGPSVWTDVAQEGVTHLRAALAELARLRGENERLRGDFFDAAGVRADDFANVRWKSGRDHARSTSPLGKATAELARARGERDAAVAMRNEADEISNRVHERLTAERDAALAVGAALERRLAAAERTIAEVAKCAVEHDDPRLDYLTVQVPRVVWEEIKHTPRESKP